MLPFGIAIPVRCHSLPVEAKRPFSERTQLLKPVPELRTLGLGEPGALASAGLRVRPFGSGITWMGQPGFGNMRAQLNRGPDLNVAASNATGKPQRLFKLNILPRAALASL